MHPVLESLRNTDKQWLIDTLYAFNGGNVEKFQGFKSAWGQQVMSLCVKIQSKALKVQPSPCLDQRAAVQLTVEDCR